MSKLYFEKIEKCFNCPNITRSNKCLKMNGKKIDFPQEIPEWCPLEDELSIDELNDFRHGKIHVIKVKVPNSNPWAKKKIE